MGRAKRGRKQREGLRHKCGKLRQLRDHGCEGYQRRVALYGNDNDPSQTADAIGRVWSSGLLVMAGKDAAALRDAGRNYHNLYWRAWGSLEPKLMVKVGGYGELVGAGSVSGGAFDADRDAKLEDAFDRRFRAISSCGRDVKSAVDQLCVDFNPDHGPDWADRLIAAKRAGQEPRPCDAIMLQKALVGLAMLV